MQKLQAVTDRKAAKATDENLTSENWEYILVGNEAAVERWYAQMLRTIRTSVIKSAQKTRGLSHPFQRSVDIQAHFLFPRAKDAIASMIKRLAHRNANVQLYTLEVRSSPYPWTEELGADHLV